MVWAGANTAGFAIANSVAYNLPMKPGEQADLEGIIMADALRTCETVADFERYLARNLGRDLGTQANFLVMDGKGGTAIFEAHNHGFKRLDAGTAPPHYLANTNFSRSGAPDQGAGYLRFERETALLEGAKPGTFTPGWVLQVAARDLGHALLTHPRAGGLEAAAGGHAGLDPHQLHDQPGQHRERRGCPGRQTGRGRAPHDDVGGAGRAGVRDRGPALGGCRPSAGRLVGG